MVNKRRFLNLFFFDKVYYITYCLENYAGVLSAGVGTLLPQLVKLIPQTENMIIETIVSTTTTKMIVNLMFLQCMAFFNFTAPRLN